jgi:hypothetical protein
VEASGDVLGTIGIFLSGMGSVLTGWLALRYERKRSEETCKERIDAFAEGIKVREQMLEADKQVLKDDE